jgi:hypothetical protein
MIRMNLNGTSVLLYCCITSVRREVILIAFSEHATAPHKNDCGQWNAVLNALFFFRGLVVRSTTFDGLGMDASAAERMIT